MEHGLKNLQKQTKGTKGRAGLAIVAPDGRRGDAAHGIEGWLAVGIGAGKTDSGA